MQVSGCNCRVCVIQQWFLQSVVPGHLEVPETSSRVHKVKTVFIKILSPCLLRCVYVSTGGAEAVVGKVAGTLAGSQGSGAKRCQQVLYSSLLMVFKKSVLFLNVLCEAVKIMNFIKSHPLKMRLFNSMWQDGMPNALQCELKYMTVCELNQLLCSWNTICTSEK